MGILVSESWRASGRLRRPCRPWPHSGHFLHPLSPLTGAHPHGLLLQDQKIPAVPGRKQAGTLHAPGAEGEPDHGRGEELDWVPGEAVPHLVLCPC